MEISEQVVKRQRWRRWEQKFRPKVKPHRASRKHRKITAPSSPELWDSRAGEGTPLSRLDREDAMGRRRCLESFRFPSRVCGTSDKISGEQ